MSEQNYHIPPGTHSHPFNDVLKYYTGSKGPSGFGSSSNAEQVASSSDGTGKVVIITGASAGLGLESTRVLASRGYDVVMAVRDMQKAEKCAEQIKQKHPDAQLTLLPLDLSSLQSVRDFVEKFKALKKPLHVLMLNAGIMATPLRFTADGYESQLQTNHLSQFLAAELLTPILIETAKKGSQGPVGSGGAPKGRIVVLSSSAHFFPKPGPKCLPFADFEKEGAEKNYDKWLQYGRTKLCNVLFAREYNLRHKGQPVEAVACHPGGIQTELSRDLSLFERMLFPFLRPFLKTVGQGAATQVYLTTAPEVVPGGFYSDCNLQPSSVPAQDAQLGAALWDWSVKHVEL